MKKTRGSSIRQNTIISLIVSGIGILYPMLVFVYIARILHPEGIGQTSFASSVAAYFVLITGLGMPIYGLRAVAEKRKSPDELSQLTAELLLIRLVTGLLAWGAFLIAAYLFGNTGKDISLLMICGLGILMAIPESSWLFKGMEDYSSLAWISAGVRALGLIALFSLVRQFSDIYTYAWIAVLIPLAINLSELIAAERKWHLDIYRKLRLVLFSGGFVQAIKKHIRPLTLFFLMSCAVTIYSHTDTVMLGLIKDEHTVGIYTCAARVKMLLPVLTGALWAAALPKAAELWKAKNTEEFQRLSGKSFHVVYVVMLPLTVYFFIFTEPWIELIGGAEYLEAAWTMRLLLLAVIPIGLSNIIGGQMLIPMGQEKKLFHAEAIGASANIAMNAVLIPFLSASGAAIATTVSELIVTVYAAYAVRKAVRVQILKKEDLVRGIAGCILAGGVSFLMARLIPMPVLWEGVLSFAIYGLVFSLLMLLFRDRLYLDICVSVKKACKTICPAFVWDGLKFVYRKCRVIYYSAMEFLLPGRMQYLCPCCGHRFRRFISGRYNEHPELYDPDRYAQMRQDVICPVCGTLPRHRILACWCGKNIENIRASRILYFAPENGMMIWMKRKGISCTTADLYNKADLKLDIQNIDLPDDSFDTIFCNHVLEHVGDFRVALKELYRILRPDGCLICSFPMDPKVELIDEAEKDLTAEERIRRFGQYDHIRVFGMKAEQFLTEAGFAVEKISGSAYPEEILPIVGPADYDINCLFCCKKKE